MRLVALAISVAALLTADLAYAQASGRQQDRRSQEQSADNGRRQRFAPLRRRANAGPCPYVKILYDAARYVELTGDRVSASNVGYTGEIEGLTSDCTYRE